MFADGRCARLSLAAVALQILTALLSAQSIQVPCEPPAKVAALLDPLPSARDFGYTYESRIGVRRAIAERNPDDFFLQRAYQDSFRTGFHLADEYDRALAMYRSRPQHALSRYFEARLLLLVQPARSKQVFQELMAANPGFVWPHVDLLEYLNLPGHRDPVKLKEHLTAFFGVCPESVEAFSTPFLPEDQELRLTLRHNLRRALEKRNRPADAHAWVRLWNFERGSAGAADRLRVDLDRIRAWPLRPTPELVAVYRSASDLLRQPALLEELETKLAGKAPKSYALLSLRQLRWHQENPPPTASDPKNRAGHQDKERAMRLDLARRSGIDCPSNEWEWMALSTRQHGEAEFRLTAEDLRVIDRVQRCRVDFLDFNLSVPPLQTLLAETYVAAKARLDQVPALLDAGFRAYERNEKYRLSIELVPQEMRARMADNLQMITERTAGIRADYFVAMGRLDDARALVEQEVRRGDAAAPEGSASPNAFRRNYQRNQWLRRLAAIEAKEGKLDEALNTYRSSLGAVGKETLAKDNHPYTAPVKRLYITKYGSTDGWLEWATGGPPVPKLDGPPPAVQFPHRLADFTAKDLHGRTWTLADFRGKATLVNYWATWCGPCRHEHRELQKLYSRLKERKNLQILTISVDENAAAASAYLKESGLTFPVIHGPSLADKLMPFAGLPTNFLVDASGNRSSWYGFLGGETGLQRMLSDLELAAKRSLP